jgi:23S rRNA pseudouridine1911/1915/1917 synthase
VSAEIQARTGHFFCDRGGLLSHFLKAQVGLSDCRIQTLFHYGAIYCNRLRLRNDHEVRSGDIVRVHFQPKRFIKADSIMVLYEDDSFIAIDKPPGLPTHPTLDNYLENAWYVMEQTLQRRLYVTHRLDVLTSGVLLLAKSPAAQVQINKLFAQRQVRKIYRAITDCPVPIGRHEHHMQMDTKPPKPVTIVPVTGSCNAVLNILNVWNVKDGHACEIELETGRTHQIRAQLGFLGCPIQGDRLYGSLKVFAPERLALECFQIQLTHLSQAIDISRPTPLVALKNVLI